MEVRQLGGSTKFGLGEEDLNSFLNLDQSTPQTIKNGIPLLNEVVDYLGSGKQLVNKEYVDANFQRVDANTGIIFVE